MVKHRSLFSHAQRRALLIVALLGVLATACGGGGEAEVAECGQDNQTGARQEWSDEASRCFRRAYQADEPAFARVVEAREGVGLATVEYTSDGSNTFELRVIPSGGVTVTSDCTRLGASNVDGRIQLDPLECEPRS